MKLVSRVSVFFLAALAAVLVVYSCVFYAFVRGRLVRQFEQESHAALNALVAAIEVEPEEVKWQPREHTIALSDARGPDAVQWLVIGDGERVVARSRQASPEVAALARALAARPPGDGEREDARGEWRILSRRLTAPAPDRSEREADEFDEIAVVVAHSAAPLHANLQRLLGLVGALPVGVWLVAAAVGRGFCRRALQPVWEMAQQARSTAGADFHARLPVSASGDELAELAAAFNTLLDRQHRAFEQQRRFAGDAAHELRTPLTVLLGQLDVSLRRPRSPEEYAATLRLLREQTVQLQQIVEALLFLARAEEDAALPDSETIVLHAWLADYGRRWNEHPRRADLCFRAAEHGAPDDCRIHASPALLTRLLDNLIENALKYSPPGSRVEVAFDCDPAEAKFSVEDRGRGIAAEDQAAIFQPFFRSREAREAGIAGAGLGLAICARIATVLGGRLACASQLGEGSRFTLRLPRVGTSFTTGNPL